jgi:hydrogenase nickel incorporation protein HypA/HybF
MHELSVAMAIVEQAEEVRQREKAVRISQITVAVGDLSGVDREALEMAFSLAAEGTAAAGAKLTLERVEAHVRCAACGEQTAVSIPFLTCKKCGSVNVEIVAGRELLLKTLELETP